MSDRSEDYLDGMRDGMTYREDHFKMLEAEIERLKAALRIKDCALRQVVSSLKTLGEDGWSEAPYLLQECRAALEGKP